MLIENKVNLNSERYICLMKGKSQEMNNLDLKLLKYNIKIDKLNNHIITTL